MTEKNKYGITMKYRKPGEICKAKPVLIDSDEFMVIAKKIILEWKDVLDKLAKR